jgi:SNF2 family DNA or RNA helicase
LLTRGTVEEMVVRMLERKRQLAGVVDEEGTGDAAGWSEGELMEMIRG